MTSVKCPACGTTVAIPPNKSGLPWWAGCLIAVAVIPIVVAVIGILAGIAIPSFISARSRAQQTACIVNMKMIEGAKDQWALSQGVTNGNPNEAALAPYLPNSKKLICPAGGTYTYHAVGQEPECSKHGTISENTASSIQPHPASMPVRADTQSKN